MYDLQLLLCCIRNGAGFVLHSADESGQIFYPILHMMLFIHVGYSPKDSHTWCGRSSLTRMSLYAVVTNHARYYRHHGLLRTALGKSTRFKPIC